MFGIKLEFNISMPEHYSSIDHLPILSWEKIHKTGGDISHLLVKPRKISNSQKNKLVKVWQNICDQYIDEFGLSEHLKSIADLQGKIGRLKIKKISTGDTSLENIIRVEEIKIEALNQRIKESSYDIYKAKQMIEKHIGGGFRLAMVNTTVREFYSYLKDINSSHKK